MRQLVAGVCVVVFASVLASSASAQIIYKPLQYQYEAFGQKFYYGGMNPRVFTFAERRAFAEQYLRYGRHPFGAPGYGDNARFSPKVTVYSDYLPPYVDAANFGFTPDDARNEALANVPRYFRKADLLKSAIVDCDGALIVPAQAPDPAVECRGTIDIRPYTGATQPATTQSTRILIIPKKLLQPKEKPVIARR